MPSGAVWGTRRGGLPRCNGFRGGGVYSVQALIPVAPCSSSTTNIGRGLVSRKRKEAVRRGHKRSHMEFKFYVGKFHARSLCLDSNQSDRS